MLVIWEVGARRFPYLMTGESVLCISEYLLPFSLVRQGRLSGSQLIDRKFCISTITVCHRRHN